MIKSFLLILTTSLVTIVTSVQKTYKVTSPDGDIKAEVTVADGKIAYSVSKGETLLISPSEIAMTLTDGTAYNGTIKLQKSNTEYVDKVHNTLLYKKAQVRENYNQLTLYFKTFDLQFRVFDAGVAYRFVSKSKTSFKVASETATFAFAQDWNMYVPYVRQHTETLETQY